MKKLFTVIILSSLFAVGCAKKSNNLARTIVRPAGTSNPNTDAQAQAVGLNINWDKTEIAEFGETTITLTHTVSVNGVAQTATHTLSTLAPICAERNKFQYNAEMINSTTANVFTAIGSTACWNGTKLYLGLSFMAWGTNSYLTQQFVNLDVTDGAMIQIQKLVSTQTNGVSLTDWFASQFTLN